MDVVCGLEARGFLFGFQIAADLGVAFVPVRKKGKLPGELYSVEYALEYGTDKFEIQKNSIKAGQKVLIVDDLLATGGTMDAACRLIEKCGGQVAECLVVIELTGLKGREKLQGVQVHSFIQYDWEGVEWKDYGGVIIPIVQIINYYYCVVIGENKRRICYKVNN